MSDYQPRQSHDTDAIRLDLRELKAQVLDLTSKVDVLCGQLSVRCQAEGERIASVERRLVEMKAEREQQIHDLRAELNARCGGISARLWGLFAGLVVVGAAAFLAHIFGSK